MRAVVVSQAGGPEVLDKVIVLNREEDDDRTEIPKEFEGKFKFSRQRSKLAGEIRGTFFVVKGEYL